MTKLAETYEALLNKNKHRTIPPEYLRVSDNTRINITERELMAAITQSNKHSSGGDDGVRYRDLQRLCSDSRIRRHVLESMNRWVHHGFPTDAKLAKVCPIPKPGKSPMAYRPISLLNCLPKLLERVLTTRLRDFVDKGIPKNQCGCRRAMSTYHCVCRLLHASAKADADETNRKHFGAVFIDYSKAYDRVDHEILLHKLKSKFDVPDALVRAIGLWLDQRYFYVDMHNTRSKVMPMTNGLPQGSSLSVLLWLVYVSDIPIPMDKSALFMDDTVFWDSDDDPKMLQHKLQMTTTTLLKWCDTNKILVNNDKTHILLNEDPMNFFLVVGDKIRRPSQRVKYLGLTLVASTSTSGPFQIDLTEVANDLRRRCRVLKPLYRKLPSKQYRIFAQGLILSKIRYYLPMIGGESEKVLHPLETAYRQCLRQVCGGLRTTPIPLLHSQTGLPPLELLIQDSSARQKMRIQNYPDSLWAQDIKSFRGEDGSPYLRFHEHDRETPTWIKDGDFEPVKILTEDQLQVLYDTEFDILPTRQAAKTALDNDDLIPRADIYLFTDGSYRPETNNAPEAAGAGALLMDSTLSQTLAEVSRKVERLIFLARDSRCVRHDLESVRTLTCGRGVRSVRWVRSMRSPMMSAWTSEW